MSEERVQQNQQLGDKWSQECITFETVSMKNYDEVKAYLEKSFFPDEPIFRSTKILGGNGIVDRFCSKLISKYMIESGLAHPTSIVARNSEGKIIGAR